PPMWLASRSQGVARMHRKIIIGTLGVALILCACGGRQRPPETGTCRPGREWVPPRQENGEWKDGYCRNIR
ncbi:MAG: hypothetical protein RMJ84_12625, partial [Sandaracinaceae bacterium]|nr:hypothetical protein [Sandaracinaceae bacterium]